MVNETEVGERLGSPCVFAAGSPIGECQLVEIQSIASVETQPLVQNVDDVLLRTRTVGSFWRERIDMTVDGGQLVFDGLLLVQRLIQVPVQDGDGVFDLLNVLVDFKLLRHEQLLDADEVEGVVTNGVDAGGKKNVLPLSKSGEREY